MSPDSTPLLTTLGVAIGERTAGSPAAHAASEAVFCHFRDLGLDPTTQEFQFRGFGPERPELIVEGERLDAGPCFFSPAAEITGEVRRLGTLVTRRGAFEMPVFAIGTQGRLYVNEWGPAIPLLPPTPPNVGGPAASIGSEDGARLSRSEGSRATLRTGGELLLGQSDRNVVAEIAGETDEAVVLCAHFDSVWRAPGAVDNASGIEGIARVAARFRGRRLRRSLVICAFAAEELGLLGSSHWVSEARLTGLLARITAAVNLDAIGSSGTLEVLASDELRPSLEGIPNVGPQLPGSDHWAFVQAGVPSVALTVHPYAEYHTPADTIDRIEHRMLDRAVELACTIVERLAA